VIQTPTTRYARGDEGDVAYQVFGDGPGLILFIQNWGSNIEAMWDEPTLRRYFDRLATFGRVVVFDKRGSGVSDPVPLDRLPSLERWMDDARLVLDEIGAEQAAVVGDAEGGPMAVLLAATYPRRISALVLVNSYARLLRAPDYRFGIPPAVAERLIVAWRREWGTGAMLELTAPSVAGDPRWRRWFGRHQRLSMSPRQALAAYQWVQQIDVRAVLPSVQAPTLVLHRRDNRYYRLAFGRFLAEAIGGARLVEIPGADVYPFHVDAEPILAEIGAFLTGTTPTVASDRVLATVLFTDIVDSTGHATRLRDAGWRRLQDAHHEVVREQLVRYGGREHGTSGDGFLASFDGPGRGLASALAIVRAVRELGIEVRAGLHTGEVERTESGIAGIAVHIAARVVDAAPPSCVWVTGTVRDLVIGSGVEFLDRGEHALKGVPGTWSLHEVAGIGPA
jgi:pimeloyl-ACP methyl ester carboxylesterase/class 3 adenylate cyclase